LGFVIGLLPRTRFLATPLCLRWRTWVAYCTLLAVAWPSLGPLPWVLDAEGHDHALAYVIDGHEASEAPGHHHHHDASDIPGSPTHPIDHNCFECQVLKHLSRCVLVQPGVPEVPLPTGSPVQPCTREESTQIVRLASLPPARGPPFGI